MTTTSPHVTDLDDRALLDAAKRLATDERRATASLLRAIMEIDRRRLYLGEGCASMFAYCTQVLHLSEGGAYNRIEAARAAREYPVILELFEQSAVTLTAFRLLAPHLTPENHVAVLASARHQSKRHIEELVASLRPKPDAPVVVRRLPAGRTATAVSGVSAPSDGRDDAAAALPSAPESRRDVARQTPLSPARIAPLAPERYRIQLTVSRETHDKFRRAQALLRHAVPSGDAAEIFDRALRLLIESLERGALPRPRDRAHRDRPPSARAMSRPLCAEGCGGATADVARSLDQKGAVARPRFSSSITLSRTPSGVLPSSKTSSSAVARTTPTRRTCFSVPMSYGRSGPAGNTRSGTSGWRAIFHPPRLWSGLPLTQMPPRARMVQPELKHLHEHVLQLRPQGPKKGGGPQLFLPSVDQRYTHQPGSTVEPSKARSPFTTVSSLAGMRARGYRCIGLSRSQLVFTWTENAQGRLACIDSVSEGGPGSIASHRLNFKISGPSAGTCRALEDGMRTFCLPQFLEDLRACRPSFPTIHEMPWRHPGRFAGGTNEKHS